MPCCCGYIKRVRNSIRLGLRNSLGIEERPSRAVVAVGSRTWGERQLAILVVLVVSDPLPFVSRLAPIARHGHLVDWTPSCALPAGLAAGGRLAHAYRSWWICGVRPDRASKATQPATASHQPQRIIGRPASSGQLASMCDVWLSMDGWRVAPSALCALAARI